MNKPKAAPPNSLTYWWNEFLFARPFLYTSSLSPEDCQTALYNIAHKVEGGWFSLRPISKTVDIQPDVDGDGSRARFDIRLKRRNRGFDYTMAKAEGSIAYDAGSGETVIHGRTKFGALYYGLLILYIVGFSLMLGNGGWWGFPGNTVAWWVILFAGILVYTLRRMYTDRNELTRVIGATLHEAELAVSAQAKLKRDDAGDRLLEDDDTPAYRQGRR